MFDVRSVQPTRQNRSSTHSNAWYSLSQLAIIMSRLVREQGEVIPPLHRWRATPLLAIDQHSARIGLPQCMHPTSYGH